MLSKGIASIPTRQIYRGSAAKKNHVQLKKGNDGSLKVQEQKVTNHRSPIQSRYLRIGAKGHKISDTLIISITFTIKQINISLSSFCLSFFF